MPPAFVPTAATIRPANSVAIELQKKVQDIFYALEEPFIISLPNLSRVSALNRLRCPTLVER